MSFTRNRVQTKQGGFVSIFTVLMFAILMSVVLVGFVRLMVDEQSQTLADDLSKSAYNSAQAGIEDAKRAMLHCASRPAASTQRTACEAQLYQTSCPGFTKGNQFTSIGISDTTYTGGKIEVGDASTNQGYSCVIVDNATPDLTGKLEANSTDDTQMYELKTDRPLSSLKIEWNRSSTDGNNLTNLRPANEFLTGGNPRATAAGWADHPPVVRATIVSVPAGGTNFVDATIKTSFIYPTSNGTRSSSALDTLPQRSMTNCTNSTTDYSCEATITFTTTNNGARNYLLLRPLYNSASYRVTGLNGTTPVNFVDVLPSIDATGYTSGVYRRVKARVHLGDNVLPLNALDVGEVCKDFLMSGGSATEDNCRTLTAVPSDPSVSPRVVNEAATCVQPHDIALVMDISSSMDARWIEGSTGPTKRDKMLQVAKNFVSYADVNPQQNHVGIISFWNSSQVNSGFTGNANSAINAIDGMRTDTGGTSYIDGLSSARTLFESNSRGGAVKRVMIFISDGSPNADQTDTAISTLASDVKNRFGVEIYAVGIKATGLGYERTLQGIVSSPVSKYYTSAETETNYEQFFAAVQANIKCT